MCDADDPSTTKSNRDRQEGDQWPAEQAPLLLAADEKAVRKSMVLQLLLHHVGSHSASYTIVDDACRRCGQHSCTSLRPAARKPPAQAAARALYGAAIPIADDVVRSFEPLFVLLLQSSALINDASDA